ncbi:MULTISPECIES: sugar ABC transporter substrate-binding protein [unclassified Enterococcus]|uniref:ABC transporter substrate-binding protein n=1 Tax=unclassified Enterococcus TaxID=2608891 RepID=UPI0015536656|nr:MULTISPECIES: sugar ABC transporter substrate-binding protein [unclassified Enterococcus]MBS7577673.1 sugar ABC transporter substrate-binding protein [Enterococcus sp. MMGLQ5-2]MBS7584133.1 sugar ABC transporter substrate-binding protein [Enterococcus sp. MMGLQ5-1]NPD11991.1 sugar ABC transporter substrate-binding protein [Enterococcus sp. MMGLQ5-1]NPD37506.1 sugar ABC transporter substrate-binding protein [Enterococcus sp. MMGLQ5-2]
MKSWKKILGTAAVASLATVLLVGCGKKNSSDSDSSDKTLKVSVWNYDTTPEFKALFAAFEKENPGVKIEPVDIAADNYDEKLTTMLSSGDKTDVLTMKNLNTYSQFAYRNQLKDLTSHIKEIDTDAAADTYKMYDIEGKTYAQPYRTDFWVLYYNKALLEKAGITDVSNLTWDDYVKYAKQLTDSSNGVYGAYQHTWRSVIQAIAGAQNDANLIDPSYDFFKPYYERTLDLQNSKAIMDYGTAKSTQVTYASQFNGEKAAMMYMGTWFMAAVIQEKEAGTSNVDWSIAPIPQKEKGKITTFGSPTGFAINKNAKNSKLAQKFLDFTSGEKGAKVLAETGVVPSYRTDEINEIYFSKKGMPTDEVALKAFSPDKIAVEFPVDKNGGAIDKILQEENDLILVGDTTPADGIKEMESRVKSEVE